MGVVEFFYIPVCIFKKIVFHDIDGLFLEMILNIGNY